MRTYDSIILVLAEVHGTGIIVTACWTVGFAKSTVLVAGVLVTGIGRWTSDSLARSRRSTERTGREWRMGALDRTIIAFLTVVKSAWIVIVADIGRVIDGALTSVGIASGGITG